MSIDYAAIAKAGGISKGRTRKSLKARKDRADAQQLKAFRDAVWNRQSHRCEFLVVHHDCAQCEHCGATVHRGPGLELTGEVHHRISRRHKATRYDPANGVLLCNHLVNNCHEKAERGEITV